MGLQDTLYNALDSMNAAIRSAYVWNCFPWQSKETAAPAKPIAVPTSGGPAMNRIVSKGNMYLRLAGISGAMAVALGAYGAHVFYQKEISEERRLVFETANRYHFFHTLALLAVPLARRPLLCGTLLLAGMTVFCGTCYHFALTGDKRFRTFTPQGGMLLIAGWLSFVV